MAFKCGSLIFSRDMMTNDQTGSIFETFAEAQRYFMGVGKLNDALTRLVNDLRNHEIDYVVITDRDQTGDPRLVTTPAALGTGRGFVGGSAC